MNAYLRISFVLGAWLAALGLATVAVVTGAVFYVEPSLPKAHELRDIRFQIPLSIYSRDGRLMAQIGEQKRAPVPYEEIPDILIKAVLAAEDDTFFNHPGLDYPGTARAIFEYLLAGGDRVAGGSTITQQVARDNFKLTRGVSLARKFKEWILAFRIEREFTKEEILGLYLNTYFFGERSYGVAAAARTYFDKTLDELTFSEAAIIAGTIQRPSEWNPYYSADNARARRAYVLRRLRTLGWISEAEYAEALAEPVLSARYAQQTALDADYAAEMVRVEMVRRFGSGAYTDGLNVTTTIDSRLQAAANDSLQATLVDYDERHGYRGPLTHVDLAGESIIDADTGELDEDLARAYLADYGDVLQFQTGLVVSIIDEQSAAVFLPSAGVEQLDMEAVGWAARYISDTATGRAPEVVSDVLSPGDVARFRRTENGSLRLAQLPNVQGAFVALDPRDGAIVSLVGGFDYFLSNYNRATQPLRQPGSAFKPFVYSAALEHGYTLASIINDAPIVEESEELERKWKPENFEGVSHGDTRLREALKRSMNQAAIRTVRDVGVGNTIRHLRKFGFGDEALPPNLNLALGGGGISAVDLANAYATFANGGHHVSRYLIQRIEDADGNVIYDASRSAVVVCQPLEVEYEGKMMEVGCDTEEDEEVASKRDHLSPRLIERQSDLYPDVRRAPRVIEAQNAYLITDILQDVIVSGSGRRAGAALRRPDIAGKTGTTNGPVDAWFAGFNADIVAAAWVGFDDGTRPLGGNNEQGGVTAIPMWIGFMREALDGTRPHALERPPGIVDVRINPENGLVASDANPHTIFEKFRVEQVPPREPNAVYVVPTSEDRPGQAPANEPIF